MSELENLKEGERRFVTVLFADMKDFTALSEKMDPEEMDGLMSHVFSAFQQIVERHDGSVEKYIGDAMVAVFGVPRIHEDDPARAVNAAIDFLDHVRKRSRLLQRRDVNVGFRIGINTGLITTGKRGQFEVVTGHAMTVAARLESFAPLNTIFVSESTREKCAEDFHFSHPYTLQVKGNGAPISAFIVKGRNANPFPDDSLFVGRDALMDTLTRAYLRHAPGATDGFFLVGEAGVGKTRLITRFVERVRQFPEADSAVLYTRAQRFQRVQFAAVSNLLSHYFQFEQEAEKSRIAESLQQSLSLDEKTVNDFVSLLVDDPARVGDNQAFVVLYMVLKAIVKKHESSPYPVMVVIDNAHFVDPQSRDFFRFFLKNADVKPFFLFGARSADDDLLDIFRGVGTVRVSPLSKEEATRLVARLWPECEDEQVISTILENSAGNPLFIREYVKFAAENRDTSTLPTTIQNIFLTSVDSYQTALRELLKKLSIFVHSFTVDDARYLQEKTDADVRVVDSGLAFFLREGILIQEQDIYMFRHDLFKQAVYSSLLNHNKRILHRLVAARMQSFADPHVLRLLHHLSSGEDFGELRHVLLAAPNVSVSMDYLRFFDVLLQHTPEQDFDDITEYLFHKSAILFNNGNSEDAYTILKRILKISIQRKNPGFSARAYHLLTAYNMKSYAFGKARLCGRKALYYYRSVPDSVSQRQNVLKLMSASELLDNHPQESDHLLEQMGALETEGRGEFLAARVESLLLRGEYGSARELVLPVVREMDHVSNDYWLSTQFLAVLAFWLVCDIPSLKATAHALSTAPSSHYANLSQIHAYCAAAAWLSGEAEDAASCLQQAEFYSYQIKNDFDRIDALRTLSEILLISGREEQAEQMALEGIAIGLRHSSYFPAFSLLILLVEMYEKRGQYGDARFFLDEATFYVEFDPLLRNRDLILYYYYANLLTEPEDSLRHLERAKDLLQLEKKRIGSNAFVKTFLTLRSFGAVENSLAGQI